MRIKGVYWITYDNGVTQMKNLIKHTDFRNIIRPKQKRIYELELLKKNRIASILKSELTMYFGEEWFTDQSPLYGAARFGFLRLPEVQGGTTECKIIKINTHENH